MIISQRIWDTGAWIVRSSALPKELLHVCLGAVSLYYLQAAQSLLPCDSPIAIIVVCCKRLLEVFFFLFGLQSQQAINKRIFLLPKFKNSKDKGKKLES